MHIMDGILLLYKNFLRSIAYIGNMDSAMLLILYQTT